MNDTPERPDGPIGPEDTAPIQPQQPAPSYSAPDPVAPDGAAPDYTSVFATAAANSTQTLSEAAVAPATKKRGRLGFAAAVVAASLLVGGGAGVGGAALYNAADDDGSSGVSTTASPTSQVVNSASTASGSVEQVASDVLPSVVKIYVQGSQEAGSGSGIILSSDGKILTNNHVVEVAGNSGKITVAFNDGTTAKATTIGTDPLTDTAVIQAEGVSGLTPATIGKSSDLKVGQSVVAIGSPFGLESTVTTGIVSALDRPVDVGSDDSGNATVYPAIQTDAAINPGNSGGPLVNMAGQVVGINASIQTASSGSSNPFSSDEEGGSIGLGFAIPIDEVWPVIQQLLDGDSPTHARLGISVQPAASDSSSAEIGLTDGAKVVAVNDGSAAQKAGIEKGDVITKVDDHLITSSDSLVATIRSYQPGDKVSVTLERDGQSKTVELTLDSDADTTNS